MSEQCSRCGKTVSTEDIKNKVETCMEHTGPQRMDTTQTCRNCGKTYPTFNTYTDGCTTTYHYVAKAQHTQQQVPAFLQQESNKQMQAPMMMEQQQQTQFIPDEQFLAK